MSFIQESLDGYCTQGKIRLDWCAQGCLNCLTFLWLSWLSWVKGALCHIVWRLSCLRQGSFAQLDQHLDNCCFDCLWVKVKNLTRLLKSTNLPVSQVVLKAPSDCTMWKPVDRNLQTVIPVSLCTNRHSVSAIAFFCSDTNQTLRKLNEMSMLWPAFSYV